MLRSDSDYDYLFKITLVGDLGVGKTSLFQRFANNRFTESYVSTVGRDFGIRTVDLSSKTIKLQIWDTGQSSLPSRQVYEAYSDAFSGTHGIFIVYDVTNADSFDNAKKMLCQIRKEFPEVVIVLIGNKCDLINKRAIDWETAKEFSDENNIEFLECSSKNATNVEKAFLTLASIKLTNLEQIKKAEKEIELKKQRENQLKRFNEVNGTYYRRNKYSIFSTIIGSLIVGGICTLYFPIWIALAIFIGTTLVFNFIVWGIDRDRSRHLNVRNNPGNELHPNEQDSLKHPPPNV